MSILQPIGPCPEEGPLATQEVGGMLERMDAQGQVTERILLSLGDWQVIPDEQGKLRVLDSMHVTAKPALLRLRVWRSRIGVAWQTGTIESTSHGIGVGEGKRERLEIAQKQQLIDCETDLQSGGERFRLIPSQQTIQAGWPPAVSRDTSSSANSSSTPESRTSETSWKEELAGLSRSMESIQGMVERWCGEGHQRVDLELWRERLRSLSSQLAFCRKQCESLGHFRLSEVNAESHEQVRENVSPPQSMVRDFDGELEESRNGALGLWQSLCADPIAFGVASFQDSREPEKADAWESLEESWESGDPLKNWEEPQDALGGVVQIQHPERGHVGEEETQAEVQVAARREESMREWLKSHFEGHHEEYLLLEQLLFQQPSRRGEDARVDSESITHRKCVAVEQQVAAGMEKRKEKSSAGGWTLTADGRADRIALLFGCVLTLGGIGMWNLNLSSWNSRFAGVVSAVIGSLWLVDSIFRISRSGQVTKPSMEG